MNIVLSNIIFIVNILMIIVNYIVTSLTIYKIAYKENVSKPWFAWIPILNDYLVIKIGQGSILFMILALASFITGGPMLALNQSSVANLSMILTAIWAVYKIYLYKGICERYQVNILLFVFGFLGQLIGQLVTIAVIINVVGHALILRNIKKGIEPKILVESKVVFNKKKR